MNKKHCGKVCGYYNPYFKADCRLGYCCKFIHLNETEYVEYCRSWNAITTEANDAYHKSLNDFNQHRYRDCLGVLKKLLVDYPVNALFHSLICKCYEKLQFEEAYFHHRKLIAIHPKDPMNYANYAMYLYRKMKPAQVSEAKQHFMKAIDLIKDTYTTSAAVIHGYFAKFLFETEKNIEKAQYHYKISLDLNDVDPRCHYNYAVLLHVMGNLKDSEYHFKQSIDNRGFCGPFFWHHFNYALLLKQLEKYKESEKEMLKCMELRPKSAMLLFEYGLLLCESMKNYDLGLFYLNEACNLKKMDRTHYVQIYNYYKNTADTLKSFENEGIISNKKNQPNQPNQPNHINEQSISHESYQWEWDQNQQNPQIQQNEDNEWKYDEGAGFGNIYNENKDDNKGEHKSRSEISRCEILMASCSNEFERFLSTKVFSDKSKSDEYYNKFANLSLNDIRSIEHLDEETLKNEVGITNKVHIKMFVAKVTKFKNDSIKFNEWLNVIGMAEYDDILSGVGILTFDSLYHYVHNTNDLLPIIGHHNKSDAQLIWMSTPKMSRNSTLI